jgi:hypothetical protein
MATDTLDARTTTTDERGAAERLMLAPATLRNMRWRGDGPPFIRIGRTIRYRLTDLAVWLDEHTRTSTSDDGSRA